VAGWDRIYGFNGIDHLARNIQLAAIILYLLANERISQVGLQFGSHPQDSKKPQLIAGAELRKYF
jgi:hypothetical protein